MNTPCLAGQQLWVNKWYNTSLRNDNIAKEFVQPAVHV